MVARVLCFAQTHLQHDERCDHIVGHVEIVSSTGLVQRKPFQRENNLTHIKKINIIIDVDCLMKSNHLKKFNIKQHESQKSMKPPHHNNRPSEVQDPVLQSETEPQV